MGGMFYRCNNLKQIDVSNFNTSNVTSCGSMFYECMELTELDLSNFNTYNITAMETMFYWDGKLKTIYVKEYNEEDKTGWTTSNVTSSRGMFTGCTKQLVGGNGTTFHSNYTDATYARIDTEETPGYFTNIKDKPVDIEQ